MTATDESHGRARTRRIRSALISSLVSKGGSLLVQAGALPLAVAALGPQSFGAYAATVAGVAWVTLVSVGAGPSLTRLMSAAIGRDDHDREAVLFANALGACALAAAVAMLVLVGLVLTPDLGRALGPAVSGHEASARTVLALLAALVPLTILGGVADAMYAAYQEQVVTNVWSLVMSLLSVPLFLAVRVTPEIPLMALAAFLPTAATKLAGLIQLVWRRRPYLRAGLRRITWAVTKELLLPGGAFALISIGSYLNTQLAIFVAGWRGAGLAAQMAVLVQMSTLVMSVAVMINNTLWPALIEAKQRRDVAWLRKAIGSAAGYNVALALGALLGLGLLTGWVAARWYKVPLANPTATSWAMGAFMATTILENMLISISFGIGSLRRTAVIFAARSALGASLYGFVSARHGVAGILVVGAVAAGGACVALAAALMGSRAVAAPRE
jgi:O-antigen/teichoic acid export membrane protein